MRRSDYGQLMLERFADYRGQRFFNRDGLFAPQRNHVLAAEHADQDLFDLHLSRWSPTERRHR